MNQWEIKYFFNRRIINLIIGVLSYSCFSVAVHEKNFSWENMSEGGEIVQRFCIFKLSIHIEKFLFMFDVQLYIYVF